MSKLAPLNKAFWVMKICATTLGETAGDLVSMTLGLGYVTSSAVFLGALAVALVFQVLSQGHRPFLFWGVILLTSTAGTTLSDTMDRTLELGYAKGSTILLAGLLCTLALWKSRTGSLAVERIHTREGELLYWTTIVFSNTLGTALGDYLADDSGLGFAGGALLLGALLAAVVVAAFHTPLSKTALFWVAFVLTRPFGATLGDFLTKPREDGGLALGTAYASLVLALVLLVMLAGTALRGTQAPAPPPQASQ